MDYTNLEKWQVIQKILENNPAKQSPKQIASLLRRSVSVVYKWAENPDASGSPMPKELEESFSLITRDNRLYGYYLFHLGYYPAPLEKGNPVNGEVMDDVMRLDVLRGELSRKLLDSLSDKKISTPEGIELNKTAELMIEELRTFQQEVREKMGE